MVGIAAATLILLAVVMWRSARNALFPPVMFAGIWGLTLLCIYLARARFLPVSEYVCLIYLAGAVAFSVGAVIVLCAHPTDSIVPSVWRSEQSTRIALDVLLVGLVALFPYYLRLALQIAGTSNIIRAIPEIRMRMVETPNANLFGIAGNLNVLAGLVASALVLETDGTWRRRARCWVAVALALAYGALTGSKGGALFLLTVFFVSQVKAKTIKVARAVLVVTLALMFFAIGIMAVNLAGSKFESAGTAASKVGEIIGGYWLDPCVAFSTVAEKPESLVSSLSIDRFFLQIGSKMGLAPDLPNINNATYIPVRGDGEGTNAYTIYFSYFKDYGWGGMLLLLGSVGMILTLLWRGAMSGAPIAILMYASMCTPILQSVEAEAFFTGLEGYLKAWALFWVLYRFIPTYAAPLWAVRRPQAVAGDL